MSDPFASRITLSVNNIPLIEAIRWITEVGRLQFKVAPRGIVITPEPAPLLTVEYDVSEKLISHLARRGSIADALSRRHLTFPEGASAVYIRSIHRLKMRNTQINHDRLAEVLGATN